MFLLPVAVSAHCSAAPQEPYEEYEGGDPTSPPVTVPSQKWGGGGGRRDASRMCFGSDLGSPDVVFNHI